MSRSPALALALVAAALPARAQFGATPMRLRKPVAYAAVQPAPIATAAPAADLVASLLSGPATSTVLFRARQLPYPVALPIPAPAIAPAYGMAGGRLRGDGAGGLAWVAVGAATVLHASFGPPPGTTTTVNVSGAGYTIAAARLVPGAADAVVVPVDVGSGTASGGRLYAATFGPAGLFAADASFTLPGGVRANDPATGDLVHAVRLSPAALGASRVQDVVLPMQDVAYVLWNGGGTSLASALTPVLVGSPGNPASHLPAGLAAPVWLHGAAAVDEDLDGAPNLFLAAVPQATGAGTGRLVEVPRGAAPGTFASPWEDVTGHADLQPLPDVQLVRPLDLGATQGMALYSVQRQELLVVTPGAAPDRFTVERLPIPGLFVRDVFAADVVGTAAPDLVVDVSTIGDPSTQYVLVYPDSGDAPPALAWAAGSPGVPYRGLDHAVAVDAADPDGAVARIDWMVGTGDAAAVASALPAATGAPPGAASFTIDGALLCDPAALPTIVARATDDLGVYVELSHAFASLQTAPPAVRVRDAVPPARVALLPGGTPVTFEADASTACGGAATFQWATAGFSAPAGTLDETATSSRWSVVLPESEYPALLAGGAAVTVTAVDAAGTATQASLPLDLDGAALVRIDDTADRATAGPGELATVSAVLRSRIGVPLPLVRVEAVLAGLEGAGAATVTGAGVASSEPGAVVLDALPAAGAEVRVDLPVRVAGAPAAAGFRAASQGGFPLGPPADVAAPGSRLPGCGCGEGAGGTLGLAAVAAAALAPRRRRRAT